MNTRKLVASSITALMIVAGNVVAQEQAPFPSQAVEVGGHWTGKVGRATTPGNDIAVYPSAAREVSSLSTAARSDRDTRDYVNAMRMADGYSTINPAVATFPSAAREFSSLYN